VDDPKRRRPDISRAKALLGWAPRVELEEGLRHTIAWFSGDAPVAKAPARAPQGIAAA
jgi:UDP-glucuronate decarboxylase